MLRVRFRYRDAKRTPRIKTESLELSSFRISTLPVDFFCFLPGFRGVLPVFFSHSGTVYVCLKYTNVKREEEDPKD